MPSKWSGLLLKWYGKNKRDLPWRRTGDPYKIWVSEIMLQQTTVETVIPYYERFLQDFPTLKDLGGAPEEDVLKRWSGLGYYSRARNLHKAAQHLMSHGEGRVPDSVEGLLELPGIGRYTAGAIASIAFERRAPIVDGNVIRVLSRLFAIEKDPKSSEGKRIFWQKAEEILPEKSLGNFNQALMELGAKVCTPENPSCPKCPVRKFCIVQKTGRLSEFPKIAKKVKYRTVRMAAAMIFQEGQVLVVQRASDGFLKGMWEFPMAEGGVEDLLKQWPVRALKTLPAVRHAVMDRRLEISPVVCSLNKKMDKKTVSRWIWPQELEEIPSSSMNRKLLRQLERQDPPITKKYGTHPQIVRRPSLTG